jgi:hypothetical protein
MKFPKTLPLAALLLAFGAAAGVYAAAAVAATWEGFPAPEAHADAAESDPAAARTAAADYPGKPAPVLLSPIARAVAASQPETASLGSLTPPDTETDAQRSLRRAAEAAAKAAGIFAHPECRPDSPVTLVGCNDYPPEDRR